VVFVVTYLFRCTLQFTDSLSRKIAWSRLGCIAYISADGLQVNLRHLNSSPSNGKWVLSEETTLAPVAETHGGNQLVHLSWNESGSEMAVVDCLGRISIYSISIALNSITGVRQANFDSSDDSNQIVGMMWLNTQRMVSFSCLLLHMKLV
jgi:mediator of RNA polymerase II transcription subunit 16